MRYFILLFAPLLALLAACGGGEETTPATSIPSSRPTDHSPTATPPQTPAATPFESLSIASPQDTKLIFTRGQRELFEPGTLWMSDLDGSNAKQLTPEGVRATFGGVDESASGMLVYYASIDSATERTLWRFDLESQEHSPLLAFAGAREFEAFASLSPDGRSVSFTDGDSIKLLDLDTGGTRLLLAGNVAACELGAGRCFVYRGSMWSPNGRLLAVEKGLWEGSQPVLIDPLASAMQEIEIGGEDPYVALAAWSPDSGAFCARHSYGGIGLYLARAPDWQAHDLVPEYNVAGQPAPRTERRVADCDWLSPERIAFVVDVADIPAGYPAIPVPSVEVSVFDLALGKPSTIAAFRDGVQMGDPRVFALPGGHQVLTQYAVDRSGGGEFVPVRPQIIDTTIGSRRSVLQDGDRVVAVVPANTPTP